MKNKNKVYILTFGVFSILNTEMGIIGILPQIAQYYKISLQQAGLLVSLFAFSVACSGIIMPLFLARFERKKVLLWVLTIFSIGNIFSAFSPNFYVLVIIRIIMGIFHPIFCSFAFSIAGSSVPRESSSKAVAKVMIGVSAGMVVGAPIANLIANFSSMQFSMLFFAFVNGIALILTKLFVPSFRENEILSYRNQVSILKNMSLWLSIIAVIFMNGAVYGVYSYFVDYLDRVSNISSNIISIVLLFYGLANILGNIIAGYFISKNALKFITLILNSLFFIYIAMYFWGYIPLIIIPLVIIWGMVAASIGGNINQYWITSIAPDRPEFANGIFISSCNLGTTLGSLFCGLIISKWGIGNVVLGGAIFILLGLSFVGLRIKIYSVSEEQCEI